MGNSPVKLFYRITGKAVLQKEDEWLGGSAHGHIGEVRGNRQLSTPKTDI